MDRVKLLLVLLIVSLSILAGCSPAAVPIPSNSVTTAPGSTAAPSITTAAITPSAPVTAPVSSPPQATQPPASQKPPLSSYVAVKGTRVTGSPIEVDASGLEKALGKELKFSWSQELPPDKYSGVEYITGNQARISEPGSARLVFTPERPGNYRFKLAVTGQGTAEELTVNVPVTLEKSPFAIRGIAYDMWHYTDKLAYMSEDFVKRAKASGANLVMISPTLYMASATANEMSAYPAEVQDKSICRGAMSDENLVKMIREAHSAGLQVLVKPILKVADPEGDWIEKKPANWDAWFQNWTAVCVHYGEIAEREKAEILAVGNELRESAAYADKWRSLISSVRKVYTGKLTYGDNSISNGLAYGDYGYFQAWDALDYIGIHFYGPLTGAYGTEKKNDPSVSEMAEVCEKYLKEVLDPIAAKYRLPVIIMEFGTGSYDGTNKEHFNFNGVLDNAEQAEYYEAGMQALSSRDYIKGINIWAYTWEPVNLAKQLTMNPSGKPAEEVVKLWFAARQE